MRQAKRKATTTRTKTTIVDPALAAMERHQKANRTFLDIAKDRARASKAETSS